MYTGRAILLIRSIIDQYPKLYLDELRDWIYFRTGETYSIPTLSRCLRRIGLSVKKVSNKLLILSVLSRRIQVKKCFARIIVALLFPAE